jgi:tRNA(Ile2) C34 agmatinyltransferase TiaS
MRKIKTNKARCRLCGDTMESVHRNDVRRCRCGEIAVDGGRSYLRRLAGNFANLEELSEYHESADKPLSELPS